MDKLGSLKKRERLALTAGMVPLETRKRMDQEAFARGQNFHKRQAERPRAVDFLLQEVAELSDHEDGRFLTQVLERMADEIRVLLIRGSTRELALCLTAIEQAKHWAIEHGSKTGSHTVFDRRIFQVDHTEAQ